MGNDYVVRLMRAKCSMGTMENYLNLPMDHGVIGPGGEPLMNANDHQSGQHVIHFGRCKACHNCKCNPKTFLPWVNGNDQHLIEGAPALTTGSKLACFFGGVISILPPEAEGEES